MTAKQKIGYKIVSSDDAKVSSDDVRYYSYAEYLARVEYKIGRKTIPKPKMGPLCLFSVFESARRSSGFAPILKVKYKPSSETKVWNGEMEMRLSDFPPNSVLADSVTPIEVVE